MFNIEKLYTEYKQDIYNYLMSLTHNHSLSEDLLSETFISAIKSIFTFKGNSSIKTWLFGIARNVWLSYIRKEKNHATYNDLLEVYVTDSIEDNLIKTEMIDKIYEILDAMDIKSKKVVKMRIEGFSYYSIAKELEISEGSARVIDFRAKKQIRLFLEKEGYCDE